MSFDEGLAHRVADLLNSIGEHRVRQKNVFGGRGFLRGKHTFLIVWADGLILKTTADEYAPALAARGVTPFAPGAEKPMSTWVTVPAEEVAEDPELGDWIARALRSLKS